MIHTITVLWFCRRNEIVEQKNNFGKSCTYALHVLWKDIILEQILRQDFIALSFCLHWNPIADLIMCDVIRNRSRITRHGNYCFFRTFDQKFSLFFRLPTQYTQYSLTDIVIRLLTTSFMRCL